VRVYIGSLKYRHYGGRISDKEGYEMGSPSTVTAGIFGAILFRAPRPDRKRWNSADDEFVIVPGKIRQGIQPYLIHSHRERCSGYKEKREEGSGPGAVMEPMNSRVLNE